MFKRPCRISPFPYTFLYSFQLFGYAQLVAVRQQTLRYTQLEVSQKNTELTKNFADALLPYFLTFLCDREVSNNILCGLLHLDGRTLDAVYLRHSLDSRMQYIKQVLCVSENGIFIILRLVSAWFLVFVHY